VEHGKDATEKSEEAHEKTTDNEQEKANLANEKGQDLLEKGKQTAHHMLDEGRQLMEKEKEKAQEGLEKGKENALHFTEKGQESIESAKNGIEQASVKAAGAVESVAAKIGTAVDTVKDKGRLILEQGKESVHHAVEKVQEKAGDISDKVNEVAETGKQKLRSVVAPENTEPEDQVLQENKVSSENKTVEASEKDQGVLETVGNVPEKTEMTQKEHMIEKAQGQSLTEKLSDAFSAVKEVLIGSKAEAGNAHDCATDQQHCTEACVTKKETRKETVTVTNPQGHGSTDTVTTVCNDGQCTTEQEHHKL